MRRLWILLLALPLALGAADVTGKWAFAVELDAGSGSPSFTFKQSGEKLTGRYYGQFGEADLTGAVKGNDIEFSFTMKNAEVGEMSVTFTGKIDGETIKGKCAYGTFASGTFTAKRAT